MKSLFTIFLSIIMIPLSAQINAPSVLNNSHIIISPEGISSKYSGGGISNIAIGLNSSISHTTGSRNLSIGTNALFYNKAQSCNVAIGYDSMLRFNSNNNGTETYNTAIGYQSLFGGNDPALNIGTFNTAVGANTLQNNTSGGANIAIGVEALENNTSGGANVAVGYRALNSNTAGSSNTAIGSNSLFYNKANYGNTAIGQNAMFYANNSITGYAANNTAVGFEALKGSTIPADNTGSGNIALGSYSMHDNTSGGQNTAVGIYSLSNNTTASNNTAIGYDAGGNLITGSGNVMLGREAGGTINVSNKLFIDNSNTNDPLIKGDFSTNELKINSKLRVGGTGDTPTATLQVDGSVAITAKIALTSSQNNLNVAGKSVIRVSGGSLVTLTGLAGGVDGMVVYIYSDNTDLNIVHLSSLSATGNQFHLAGGFPSDTMSITGSGGAHFIYDAESGLWRLIGSKL